MEPIHQKGAEVRTLKQRQKRKDLLFLETLRTALKTCGCLGAPPVWMAWGRRHANRKLLLKQSTMGADTDSWGLGLRAQGQDRRG